MTAIAVPRLSSAFAGAPQHSDNLVHVQLIWMEKRQENWIRFGTHTHEQIVDRRRRILSYRPGAIFAFVRWAANDFGTVTSRIDIVQAMSPGEAYQTLPFVRPGGELLLKVESWPRVERVLQAIDTIERLGIEPESVSPDHWRNIHNRITAGQAPRSYTLDQHRAALLRRRVGL
ncbi:DUF2840 domain-containing protein [Mesorhizobium sp. WSM4935]|uniref:DUF2840 domain-containing protein n=1 Tax=Mesorhizobium sp. WSM4935 TaxID=3038547 RepID=UPI00241571E7|nr:DUF2840 domain-containing protein [Mesorhizobium sp. WSM4935]MDG4875255.1 DUF2840 domain-containing protein [Mesorhizobium sp. WSM4935]